MAKAKREKRERQTVPVTFSRFLNDKLDEYPTVLEIERDDEPGNMNNPGSILRYHIAGRVPDGEYTLNYRLSGKSEKVTVRMNNIVSI
jgi:hypothetical protein